MKCLHLIDDAGFACRAMEARLQALIAYQRCNHWHSQWALTGAGHDLAGSPRPDLDWRDSGLAILRWLRLLRRLKQAAESADVVHVHSGLINLLAAIWLRRRYSFALICELPPVAGIGRGGVLPDRFLAELQRFAARRVQALVAPTGDIRDQLIATGVDSDKAFVVPVAIDRLPGERRRENGLALAVVGPVQRWDDLQIVLNALPRVLLKFPDVRLLVNRGGEHSGRIQRQVESLGLQEYVVLLNGEVTVEELARMADVLIFPQSRMTDFQICDLQGPLVAMAFGRLLLAADSPGYRECLHHADSGLLFQSNNEEDLTGKLMHLLRHQESWPAQRVAARRYVYHERTWKAVIPRYQRIYHQLKHHDPGAGVQA